MCSRRCAENYPALDIPFHARWRHFAAGGVDRWAKLAASAPWPDAASRARSAFDLAIVSVLLDAGAGPDWRYRARRRFAPCRARKGSRSPPSTCSRSGAFSADPRDKLARGRLAACLHRGLRTRRGLPGLRRQIRSSGSRAARRCCGRSGARSRQHRRSSPRETSAAGRALRPSRRDRRSAPRASTRRIHFGSRAHASRADLAVAPVARRRPARRLLAPSGVRRDDATNGLLPFHKLSQWLSYSLIEPLQEAGIKVVDIDGLTGLPEYRNGGLFIDLGAVSLKRQRGNIEAS